MFKAEKKVLEKKAKAIEKEITLEKGILDKVRNIFNSEDKEPKQKNTEAENADRIASTIPIASEGDRRARQVHQGDRRRGNSRQGLDIAVSKVANQFVSAGNDGGDIGGDAGLITTSLAGLAANLTNACWS